MTIDELEVLSQETIGEGGFLVIRRTRVRHQRVDGSYSEIYECDYATRPDGVDAIAVAVWRRVASGVEVLLRAQLRPVLRLGRSTGSDDADRKNAPLMLWEVVAGLVEPEDEGEDGVMQRAVHEVWEESGYRVTAEQIEGLGAPFFASPGSLCQRVYAAAVEISRDAEQHPLPGDGSPMEDGATTRWVPIDDAIEECVAGRIQDLKTEVLLRRLRERVASER